MLVRYLNDDGTHGYEEIDFRETMPAAGNVTVSESFRDGIMELAAEILHFFCMVDVLCCGCQPNLINHWRSRCRSSRRNARMGTIA